jgi:prepilin-type N-terminal cleavage/methylation domain-containing protein
MQKRNRHGFTLIELIASLVLLGIIAVFGGMFVVQGMEGYLFSKKNSEKALKAQIALDRIALELRNLNGTDTGSFDFTENDSVTFTSTDLPGTRELGFSGGSIFLGVNNQDHLLIDEVSSFGLNENGSFANLDYAITVSFDYADLPGGYSITVVPRLQNGTQMQNSRWYFEKQK